MIISVHAIIPDTNSTVVEAHGALVDVPGGAVGLPRRAVDLPHGAVGLPGGVVDVSRTVVDLPRALADVREGFADVEKFRPAPGCPFFLPTSNLQLLLTFFLHLKLIGVYNFSITTPFKLNVGVRKNANV